MKPLLLLLTCVCSYKALVYVYMISMHNIIVTIHTLVAAKVAEKSNYKIVSHSVEVVLISGDLTSVESTSHSNNTLILKHVPSSMNDDMLMLYIDNITELEGEQKDYSIDQNNTEVVITFNVPLDTQKFPNGMYIAMCNLQCFSLYYLKIIIEQYTVYTMLFQKILLETAMITI